MQQWNDIIALRQRRRAVDGDRQGRRLPRPRRAATASHCPPPAAEPAAPAQSPAILGMVAGPRRRGWRKSGGPLADWTQLVRSEIVLGDLDQGADGLRRSRKAYPDAGERAELDALAAQAGLKLDGGAK